MQIKDLFEKKIDRNIQGVIKVEQADSVIMKQELEEYVVTQELRKHFNNFFSNYSKGINGKTDKMGVWISGFFGSGKSHFLKILSYIIDGKVVDGKKAVDYFVDGDKIIDQTTIANMRLASNTPSDVILFNIDSKSSATSKKNKDAILSVFLKVFNEQQGFCGSKPHVAELERKLVSQNRYEEFKLQFAQKVGKEWVEMRHEFSFIQDEIVEVLVEMKFMSTESARNWCETAMGEYQLSIEDFAKMVRKYIDSKEPNHHVVFMVDEIGQYIGDSNELMLNLQTIAEDLGIYCQGKAWVIVTGQQDIDSIIHVVGNNFSKIQGRFDTRIALSSADVDVVIRKRILEKTKTATPMLEMMYEQKASIIKNAVIFSDTAEMKLYKDKNDFATDYPFIPYQFYILGRTLNAIREHGSSGKHMSEGERSMIALFQDSTINIKTKETGVLIPFCDFYAPIEKFVEHNHSSVITNAAKNTKLQDIDVQILKVLFMIKYVKEMTATVDNLTTLMLSSIDQDRLLLRKEIEESLQRLIKQTLVQKTLNSGKEIFVFLTNEEQDVAREISKTNVESREILDEISTLLFNDIYQNTKYKCDSAHNYSFNKIVDDIYCGNIQSNDIGIKVITPLSVKIADSTAYTMQSQIEKNVLVVLPEQMAYCEEIITAKQIEKYLTKNTLSSVPNIKAIAATKYAEAQERKERAKSFLEEAVKEADFYIGGSKLQSSSRDASSKIDEAIKKLFEVVYNKLSYMDTPVTESDILNLFSHSNNTTINLNNIKESNLLALNDVQDFIGMNTKRKIKTNLKTIKERYTKAPYGFSNVDVEWIVAKLFKQGDVNMTVNGAPISMTNKSPDDICRYFSKKDYLERSLFEKREKVSEKQKKVAKNLFEVLFSEKNVPDEEDAIITLFKKRASSLINFDFREYERKYTVDPKLPGCEVLKNGRVMLQTIIDIDFPSEFFQIVDNRAEDLIDFHDEFAKIKEFFKSEQVNYFEKALKTIYVFKESKTYIADTSIDDRINAIEQVVNMANPYSEIYRLPERLEAFYKKYDVLLDSIMEPVLSEISIARTRVFDELTKTDFEKQQTERVVRIFDEFKDKAESSENIATLKNLSLEVETMKVRLINEFDETQQRLELQKQSQNDNSSNEEIKPTPVLKRRKIVTFKSVFSGQSWNISNENDLDKCLSDIKARLMKELESGDIKVED